MIIAEAIRYRTEECTVQSVLNCITLYSEEWYNIGVNLGLPSNDLEVISQQCHASNPVPHLVELWYRWDPHGISWEKLYLALKKTVEVRLSSTSHQYLPITAEELVPDFSLEMETESVEGIVRACMWYS